MAEKKRDVADEIRHLIEQVDGRLREAERLRSYVNDRDRRAAFFPERRKAPRVPPAPPDPPHDTR